MSDRPDPSARSSTDTRVERIAGRLPGYRGYLQEETRQASDQATRRYICDRLVDAVTQLDRVAAQMVERGELDGLGPLDQLRRRFTQFERQIAAALPPRSKLFTTQRLDADLLEDLYDADQQLMDLAESLPAQVRTAQPEELEPFCSHVTRALDRLAQQWEVRTQLVGQLRRSDS